MTERKMIYLDSREIERYQATITTLRNELEQIRIEKLNLTEDIKFLKDNGEEILVIVKKPDNDIYEFRSSEKELLLELVSENQNVREKHDNIIRIKDNIENQKQMLILKYHEMSSSYQKEINDLTSYVETLEKRNIFERVVNIKKNKYNNSNILANTTLLEEEIIDIIPEKTLYSKEDIERLQEESKKVRKQRGWHFKEEFIDSEGNVYHKGKIQPHLKKSL